MKIILSHDVDHLYWSEHYVTDLYLQGYLWRNVKGLLKNQTSFTLYIKRLKVWGRMHRIPELIKFYDENQLKASFFFGMANGLRLSYKYTRTESLIKSLKTHGHEIGVHAISFNEKDRISLEFKRFEEVSKLSKFGVRTHYLRKSDSSLSLFNDQNYLYDSSIEKIDQPFVNDRIWEIPISLMDASLVPDAQLNQDIKKWKENSLAKYNKAVEKKIPYFVINFHDLYFSEYYPTIRDWFLWFVEFLNSNKHSFITFSEAVNELNN